MCRNWCEYRYDAIELSKSHWDEEMQIQPRCTKVFGFPPTLCTKVQSYGKRRAVFLLQFPGMLEMGAPSGRKLPLRGNLNNRRECAPRAHIYTTGMRAGGVAMKLRCRAG